MRKVTLTKNGDKYIVVLQENETVLATKQSQFSSEALLTTMEWLNDAKLPNRKILYRGDK